MNQVEFLSIFIISSLPAQTQSSQIENFPATVLSLLFIPLCPQESQFYSNETRFEYLRAQRHGHPKILGGSKCLILGEQQYCV